MPDQLAHVLTARAIAALANLFIRKGLQGIGQGNVHRAHAKKLDALAKLGKPSYSSDCPDLGWASACTRFLRKQASRPPDLEWALDSMPVKADSVGPLAPNPKPPQKAVRRLAG